MSKQIAQTVGDKRVAVLIALFAAFIVLATVVTQFRSADAQAEPEAALVYDKSADESENLVVWTISVTNVGDSDSEELFIQDTLPAGADWIISSDNIGCDLSESTLDARLVLNCGPFIAPMVDTDGVDTITTKSVSVSGIVACGSYTNTALFLPDEEQRTAVAVVACPTPIPTPTATATPTPIPPTQTPVVITATPTPTLNDPVPTATNTPNRSLAPRPPNTGDTVSQGSDNTAAWLYAALGLGAIAFGVGGFAVARRSP